MEDIQKYIKNQLVNQENENFEGSMEYLFGPQNNMMVNEGLIRNLTKKFWKWIKSFRKSKIAKQFANWTDNNKDFNFHKINGTNIVLSNVICIPFLELYGILLKLIQVRVDAELSFLLFNIFYDKNPGHINSKDVRKHNQKRCQLLDNPHFEKYCPLSKIKVLINFITAPNKVVLYPAGICIYIPLEDVDIKTLEKERGIKFPNKFKKYPAMTFISPTGASFSETSYGGDDLFDDNDRIKDMIRSKACYSIWTSLEDTTQNLVRGNYIDYYDLITNEEYKK